MIRNWDKYVPILKIGTKMTIFKYNGHIVATSQFNFGNVLYFFPEVNKWYNQSLSLEDVRVTSNNPMIYFRESKICKINVRGLTVIFDEIEEMNEK